jgi:hypothetical protein
MNTTVRELAPEFDNKGNPSWKTRLSAPDDSYALIKMIPDRIIPVIFVPGVMGSNLQGTGDSKGVQWLLDSLGGMGWDWALANEKYRKKHLNPSTMRVLDSGKIDPGQTGIPVEEFKRRGWGEVGFTSYGAFLQWLEHALNDFQNPESGERAALRKNTLQALVGESLLPESDYALSYKYRFPVYACGYNWLDSNATAAQRLGQCIDAAIQRYKADKKKCEKVIIVTHSMGGLVARHCSEVGGYRDKIFGIVHGVMPAIGAAAVYRRFKSGTEGAVGPAMVLGNNAAEMTAVLSSAPGPLQLLPTPEYGNGWLKIKDGANEHSLPRNGDPYGEIYTVRDKWWGMCEDELINPLNEERNPKKRQAVVEKDWKAFKALIEQTVWTFHTEITGKYHPNTHAFAGVDTSTKAYGTVTWSGGSLFGNKRPTDSLDRSALTPEDLKAMKRPEPEIKGYRTVKGRYTDGGWFPEMERTYYISEPDEDGDGTVPQRSGRAVRKACLSYAEVKVGHEPAYKFAEGAEYARACRFTLRAIVKIAQDVQTTSLKYD